MPCDPPLNRAEELWPAYHLSVLPEEGVACPYDPNGAIYWNGRYHLMYIYQDPSLPRGGHCWGHWSSADLVNWEIHPPCLVPEAEGTGLGIFSGNAFVNKDGLPMLCWYGINAGVCVATAKDDDLIEWENHPANPIIVQPMQEGDTGYNVYGVFDPYLWLEGETYCCLLAANRLPDGKDTLYVMTSPDLVNWTPRHHLFEHSDLTWTLTAEDCSCPDFFALGDRHVLLCISHVLGSRCYLGKFDQAEWRFRPDRHVRMNWPGGTFFAPESLLAPDGRRLFWGWVTDVRVGPTRDRTGSGVQSLPRVMELDAEGNLRLSPAQELQALRGRHCDLPPTEIPPGDTLLQGVAGSQLELALELDPRRARAVGAKVYCSLDGREETAIWYDAARQRLVVDVTWSTLRDDVSYHVGPIGIYSLLAHRDNHQKVSTIEAPLALAAGETLKLRVFLDGPVLEVFANERQCVTTQVFPALPESRQVKLCARGGTGTLVGGEAWEMGAIEMVDHKRA
jgi:beta-fructofuranosidase